MSNSFDDSFGSSTSIIQEVDLISNKIQDIQVHDNKLESIHRIQTDESLLNAGIFYLVNF